MRIAFLLDTFPKTSETFVVNQIVGLLERGHWVAYVRCWASPH
jgi:colanic acid/amylovoran biosynthesis glycosyltransferase